MTQRRLPQRPHANRKNLTRREALLLLGAMGGVGAVTLCGGTAGLALLLVRRTPAPVATPNIQIITDTPTDMPAQTGYPKPPIVSRAEWGAQPVNHDALYENGFASADNPDGWSIYPDYRHDYQTLVIHHSVIYDNDDLTSVQDVQALHQTDRAWADVGYHFLVGKGGSIYEGRDLQVRGTHVAGYNTGSVGVCLLGNTSVDGVPDAQWQALGQISFWLKDFLTLTHIAAHRDFNPQTECPGNTLYDALDQLAEAIGLIRGIDGYIPQAREAQVQVACACEHCNTSNA
jgi:hypothetical protein